MPAPSAQRSISVRVRRLIEQYTPDETFGRLGLAAITGPVGVYSLMIAFGFAVNLWIGSLLIVPVAAFIGLFLTAVTVLTLWPVYLAAIDHISDPVDYPRESEDEPPVSQTERLKAKYRRGELSDDEFERQLEAALERDPDEADLDRSSTSTAESVKEPEHRTG